MKEWGVGMVTKIYHGGPRDVVYRVCWQDTSLEPQRGQHCYDNQLVKVTADDH